MLDTGYLMLDIGGEEREIGYWILVINRTLVEDPGFYRWEYANSYFCMTNKLKIGLKFCGGCNPTYDRGLMAEKIRNDLDDKADFLTIIEDNVDMVVSIQGCDTSCADLQPFKDYDVKIINSVDDAEAFIEQINKTVNSK